jgi:hypothetical protein
MKWNRTVVLCLWASILMSSLAVCVEAQGSERDRAESAAVGFLKAFEQGDLRPAYRERISQSFKQQASEEAFVAQFSIVRSQFGGPGSGRQLIDERPLSQIPNTPLRGTFYFFRYKTQYPAGKAYEDIYLEKEGDGAWKVVGSWFFPAQE